MKHNPFVSLHPYRLLLVRLSAMGDVIHTLPAVRALHRRYPKTRLVYLVDDRNADIVEGLKDLERVMVFNRRDATSRFMSFHFIWLAFQFILEFVMKLRKLRCNGSFDFHMLLRSGFFAWASGARIRMALRTWKEGNRLFQNHTVKKPKTLHAIDRNLHLVSQAVGASDKAERVPVPVVREEKARCDLFLKQHGLTSKGFFLLLPAASRRAKMLPMETYVEVLNRVAEYSGLAGVIVTGPGEERIAAQLSESTEGRFVVADKMGIKALAALALQARIAIGVDTGPLHLCAAQGTPVVGIYGPTDPLEFGPYWEPYEVVDAAAGEKRYSQRKLRKRKSPCPSLESLDADTVVQATLRLLAKSESETGKSSVV